MPRDTLEVNIERTFTDIVWESMAEYLQRANYVSCEIKFRISYKHKFIFRRINVKCARYILHYTAGYLTGTNAINIDLSNLHSKKEDDSRRTVTGPPRAVDDCGLDRPYEDK
jgi:hypothetical protein